MPLLNRDTLNADLFKVSKKTVSLSEILTTLLEYLKLDRNTFMILKMKQKKLVFFSLFGIVG